jgi:hypothetical protein
MAQVKDLLMNFDPRAAIFSGACAGGVNLHDRPDWGGFFANSRNLRQTDN